MADRQRSTLPRLVLDDLGLRGHFATHEAHHFMSSYSNRDLAWRFMTHFRYSRTPLRIILVVTHIGEDVVPRSIDQNGARHGSHETTLPPQRGQPVHAGHLPEHRWSRPMLHTRDRRSQPLKSSTKAAHRCRHERVELAMTARFDPALTSSPRTYDCIVGTATRCSYLTTMFRRGCRRSRGSRSLVRVRHRRHTAAS